MKKIAIIGAGPGGLSAGMLLANKGHEVEIFEKKPYIGGRNSELKLGEYKFDLGPTFFLMKYILEEIFEHTGRKLEDYVKLQRIEPMYRLKFSEDKVFYPYSHMDKEKMFKEIERVFPGEKINYDKYIEKESVKYDRIVGCLSIPYDNLSSYLKPQFLKAIPFLDAHLSLYDVLSRYFTAEELKLAFTFQAKYIGMSPWKAPGTFSIISYIEHALGIFHVEGGLNKLCEAMAKSFSEDGGTIHLDKGVKNLIIEGKDVKGIELYNGEKKFYDKVIINADFAHAMKELIPQDKRQKYSDEKLDKKEFSCSTFMLYLGVNKIYEDIAHHSIIFAKDYRKNVDDIVTNLKLSEDFSVYVQNASVMDKTLAPEGKSTLYVLVPVPNNKAGIDWDLIKEEMKEKVLDLMETKGEYTDLRSHIEECKIITPDNWEKNYDVFLGATFNLGHQVTQMLSLRPHNRFEILNNLYLVGGGTHPGSGLPTIYESGRITANLIEEDFSK